MGGSNSQQRPVNNPFQSARRQTGSGSRITYSNPSPATLLPSHQYSQRNRPTAGGSMTPLQRCRWLMQVTFLCMIFYLSYSILVAPLFLAASTTIAPPLSTKTSMTTTTTINNTGNRDKSRTGILVNTNPSDSGTKRVSGIERDDSVSGGQRSETLTNRNGSSLRGRNDAIQNEQVRKPKVGDENEAQHKPEYQQQDATDDTSKEMEIPTPLEPPQELELNEHLHHLDIRVPPVPVGEGIPPLVEDVVSMTKNDPKSNTIPEPFDYHEFHRAQKKQDPFMLDRLPDEMGQYLKQQHVEDSREAKRTGTANVDSSYREHENHNHTGKAVNETAPYRSDPLPPRGMDFHNLNDDLDPYSNSNHHPGKRRETAKPVQSNTTNAAIIAKVDDGQEEEIHDEHLGLPPGMSLDDDSGNNEKILDEKAMAGQPWKDKSLDTSMDHGGDRSHLLESKGQVSKRGSNTYPTATLLNQTEGRDGLPLATISSTLQHESERGTTSSNATSNRTRPALSNDEPSTDNGEHVKILTNNQNRTFLKTDTTTVREREDVNGVEGAASIVTSQNETTSLLTVAIRDNSQTNSSNEMTNITTTTNHIPRTTSLTTMNRTDGAATSFVNETICDENQDENRCQRSNITTARPQVGGSASLVHHDVTSDTLFNVSVAAVVDTNGSLGQKAIGNDQIDSDSKNSDSDGRETNGKAGTQPNAKDLNQTSADDSSVESTKEPSKSTNDTTLQLQLISEGQTITGSQEDIGRTNLTRRTSSPSNKGVTRSLAPSIIREKDDGDFETKKYETIVEASSSSESSTYSNSTGSDIIRKGEQRKSDDRVEHLVIAPDHRKGSKKETGGEKKIDTKIVNELKEHGSEKLSKRDSSVIGHAKSNKDVVEILDGIERTAKQSKLDATASRADVHKPKESALQVFAKNNSTSVERGYEIQQVVDREENFVDSESSTNLRRKKKKKLPATTE